MEAMKVTARVIDVTPEMAKEWLSRNPRNRHLSESRVATYVSAMNKGEWLLNGESITIDANGCLKNGQHRLSAIARYGKPVPTVVVEGVDPSVNLFDRHGKRSMVDTLRIGGMPSNLANSNTVGCAMIDMQIRLAEKYPTEEDVRWWLEEHSNAVLAAVRCCAYSTGYKGRVNTKFSPLMLAVIYAYESGVPESKLFAFAEAIRNGIVTANDQTAAVVLRNDLIAMVIPKNGEARLAWVACCERAIYDYAHGIPRRKTYKGSTDHCYMWTLNN